MSRIENPLLSETVRSEWIDYNGHMTDSAYATVFSLAVDQLMVELGIDADFRNHYQYSIYTLETHLCYLDEAHEGQDLRVTVQLLDYDTKRLHVFFVMENGHGDILATSEQMLMGMDMNEGRPAPFPLEIQSQVEALGNAHENLPRPEKAGRKIGIRRK
ncbi:acyl-CoA thioester hydrolase [Bacillus pakistanensis]|uniref:Acyl-CoA thioester hydrolase n=1 Tax=Rossellomorea pakistanensis TaxID=992288 RepID=A0ABS2NE08_9BACI|nr:thioesterase family protein [Bacillus pakistanensis]MBM7586092.1 acyl-CoA thioester hydrolase [Bacillus pakistanensis]